MCFLYKFLSLLYYLVVLMVVIAGTGIFAFFCVEKGTEIYEAWKQKPVIVKQEVVSRPTTVESEMAEMLGWYQLKLKQASEFVSNQSKEIQRLEERINTLEKYIEENELPVPAEPLNIDFLIP